ncbi:MAG: outer membrane beta-barrel protein [Nonlabens sp.]|uniref:outer membrane beta-barrel protein n=1 Tax=Nonlabens sp. TaxID=1888209 RepID=UPI003EF8649C
MKLFHLTLILLFIPIIAFSQASKKQDQVTITGTLIDKATKTPLEFATVSLISTAPGALPQGGITDLDGKYSIKVIPGTYDVKWEYITFKTIIKKGEVITGDKDYGIMELEIDVAELDAAIVIAEKTTVDIRLDKKIYNIGKDLTVRGGTASDVLDNVPSVSVDVEGNVALRGNDNVTILIDGRPSALVGFNGADALRQIPAEAIEKIEVITSPSARYDAEGTAGILNIILRKNKLVGFNGSLQANTGYPENHGLSFNGNYRTEKFNLFTNTGFNYRERPGNATTNTEFFTNNAQNRFVDETRIFDRLGRNFFTSLGAEYYIDQKSSIVANAIYRYGNDDDVSTNTINRFDDNRNLNEATLRREEESENEDRVQFTLDYKNDLDENGQKLTASMQYSISLEQELADILETETVQNVVNDVEFTEGNEDERNALVQIDYELPVGEDVQYEAGYRGNYRDISNAFYLAEAADLNSPLVPDLGLNNTFVYQELVNAVYGQYGREINKFSLLAGLRFEQTDVTISQETTDSKTKKNYSSLFPTINLGYEIADGENITLGYNRRIRRPRGRSLNPFPSRSSESNIFQGNVDLNPSFANSLDLGYLKRWKKVTLSTSVYFNRSTDNWQYIQEDTGQVTDNGDPIIRRFPVNLSTQDRLGYELTLTYRPFKWWTINSDLNVYRVETDGDFGGQSFDFVNTTYFARLNQKVTLPSNYDFQANFNYRGASEDAQGTNDGIASLNLAVSKDLFNERATITANLSDVFNSRKRQGTTTGTAFNDVTMQEEISFITDSEYQFRQRQFTVAFVYRFNQKKRNERNSNRDGGGDDEFEG